MALTFQEFGAMVQDWYTSPQSLPIAYTVTGLAAALVLAVAITATILIKRHRNNKITKVEELPKQEEKPKPEEKPKQTIEQKGTAKDQQQIVINMPIHQTTTINQAPEIIDDARNVSEALTNVVTILEKVNTAVETRDIVYLSPIVEPAPVKQKPQTPIINNIINIPQLPTITQIIVEAKNFDASDLLADF